MPKIVIWAQIADHEAEKVKLDDSADIADLKEELLGKEARKYQVYYNGQQLKPSTIVPSGTTCENPVLLKISQDNSCAVVSTENLAPTVNNNVSNVESIRSKYVAVGQIARDASRAG
ncbi:unnamed protein product, partial [Didymodactylos carnosus]